MLGPAPAAAPSAAAISRNTLIDKESNLTREQQQQQQQHRKRSSSIGQPPLPPVVAPLVQPLRLVQAFSPLVHDAALQSSVYNNDSFHSSSSVVHKRAKRNRSAEAYNFAQDEAQHDAGRSSRASDAAATAASSTHASIPSMNYPQQLELQQQQQQQQLLLSSQYHLPLQQQQPQLQPQLQPLPLQPRQIESLPYCYDAPRARPWLDYFHQGQEYRNNVHHISMASSVDQYNLEQWSAPRAALGPYSAAAALAAALGVPQERLWAGSYPSSARAVQVATAQPHCEQNLLVVPPFHASRLDNTGLQSSPHTRLNEITATIPAAEAALASQIPPALVDYLVRASSSSSSSHANGTVAVSLPVLMPRPTSTSLPPTALPAAATTNHDVTTEFRIVQPMQPALAPALQNASTILTLYHERDHDVLSPHQVLLRQHIQVISATIAHASTHVRGRNKPIRVGQVGITCRHCAHWPIALRTRGAIYFPATLNGLYQAAQNINAHHFTSSSTSTGTVCRAMPLPLQEQFRQLESTKMTLQSSYTSVAGRTYWAQSARDVLGLVDTEHGIAVASSSALSAAKSTGSTTTVSTTLASAALTVPPKGS